MLSSVQPSFTRNAPTEGIEFGLLFRRQVELPRKSASIPSFPESLAQQAFFSPAKAELVTRRTVAIRAKDVFIMRMSSHGGARNSTSSSARPRSRSACAKIDFASPWIGSPCPDHNLPEVPFQERSHRGRKRLLVSNHQPKECANATQPRQTHDALRKEPRPATGLRGKWNIKSASTSVRDAR